MAWGEFIAGVGAGISGTVIIAILLFKAYSAWARQIS